MNVLLPDLRYPVQAIVQAGSRIWKTQDRNSIMLVCSAAAAGSIKLYGSVDYDDRDVAMVADPSLATWVPIPSTTLAGVATALNVAFTPVDDRANVASCTGFPYIRAVEQNAGTCSLTLVATAFTLAQLLGAVAVAVTADTELPAAVLLAENMANPTPPAVGSFLMIWDGATWDRAPGNSTDGVLVNLGANNDVTVTSGAITSSHGKTIKIFSGTLTADTDVVAAVASKRIKVFALYLRVITNTEQILIIKSNGTGGTELWRAYLRGPAADVPDGNNLAVPVPSFLFATVAGEKLTFDVSSAAALHYSGSYWDDDAA